MSYNSFPLTNLVHHTGAAPASGVIDVHSDPDFAALARGWSLARYAGQLRQVGSRQKRGPRTGSRYNPQAAWPWARTPVLLLKTILDAQVAAAK